MVAAEQDVGHRHAAELARPGVLRVLKATGGVAVRFLDQASLVAEHAGHVPHDRVDHDHRRHFAAVADEVADGNLAGVQTQADALVKALVPAAQQEQSLPRRQFPDQRLRQTLPRRGEQYQFAGL